MKDAIIKYGLMEDEIRGRTHTWVSILTDWVAMDNVGVKREEIRADICAMIISIVEDEIMGIK